MRKNYAVPNRRPRSVYAGALFFMALLIGGAVSHKWTASAAKTPLETELRTSPVFRATSDFRPLDMVISSGFVLAPQPPASSQPVGLIGLESISLGSTPAVIDSFDSANGPYSASNKGSAAILIGNQSILIDGAKMYGNVRSTSAGVSLKSSSLVTGDVIAGTTITNGGTIQGSVVPNSPSAPIVAPPVAECSPFSSPTGMSGKFTYNALKGDLTVSGNNTATLANGTYCLHNLTLAGSGKLVVNGSVTIRLNGEFNASGSSSTSTGGVPANLQILSSSTSSNGVLLSGTADLYMTIYAPQANVILSGPLSGSTQLYGSVLGKTLSTSGHVALHFDARLAANQPVNTAPVVNAGANQTITLPATATLAGSATDDGLPNPPATLAYQWSQISGPATASITSPNQTSTTVSFPTAGIYVFRLAASDSALSGSATVQVIVNPPVNQPPVVNAGANQTITLPATAALAGSATDDGLPNPPATLAYQWSQISGPATASITSPNQTSTTVSFPTAGTYVFRLSASDSALSGSATVQVTVNPQVNQPPNVSAGSNQTITLPASAALNGSASDDGLPNPPNSLSYAWSQDSGPVPALVSAPAQVGTTAKFVQPGTYVLRLMASDGTLSSSAATQITVIDGPPSLAVADRTISVGTKISMQLAADDPNASDTLTYFLDDAPAGAAFNPNPVIVWTPTSAQVGNNTFTARVVDAAGHSDSKTFHIIVTPQNHPPQLGLQSDERVPTGGNFARTLAATDPDAGDPLTFALVSGPAGLALSGNQLAWNPVTNTAGDYFVTVKVTDAAGVLDSARFKLSVFPVSAPAARDDFYKTSLGQSLFVDPLSGVLANDADPNGGSLTAAKLTNPDKGTVTGFNADGSFNFVAPAAPSGPVLDVKLAGTMGAAGTGDGSILVADVDGDGKPDVISTESVCCANSELHVYSGDTGAQLFHFTFIPPAQVGGKNCALTGTAGSFAAADVDDDGKVEIVLPAHCNGDINVGNRVIAVARDASLPEGFRIKWLSPEIFNFSDYMSFRLSNSDYTIARLHPNEKPVVLFGQAFSRTQRCQMAFGTSDAACRGVWALNGNDGSLNHVYYSAPADQTFISGAYDWGSGGFGVQQMGPIVADVDNDGALEILFEGTLWNTDGTVRRQFDGNAPRTATQSSVVVDLDGDPEMEIVTLDDANGDYSVGSLKAWKADGRLLWEIPLPRHWESELSVADVDRDGRPDFIFTLDDTIWVIDYSGRIKWVRSFRGATDNFTFQFLGRVNLPVYDLNGDGIPEMVVQYGSQTIKFLRADTGEDETSWTSPGAPFYQDANRNIEPVIADLDGSGHASIIFYRGDYPNFCACVPLLVVLRGDTVPWQPAPNHYNQWAYSESAFNADGSVPLTHTRHTTDPRTNVFRQQPQAPYGPGFVPSTETSFNYAATNTAGLSTTATVKIKIDPLNHPPVFTTKPPKAYVGPHVQMDIDYFAHAVDPDLNDTITYAIVFNQGSNAFASVNPSTGQYHLSQLYQDDQSYIISATDNHGSSSYQTFTMHMSTAFTSVPGVVGMTQSGAATALTNASLSVGDVTEQFNSAPAGTVLGQSPGAGTNVAKNESVDLTVSLGPTPVVVPNVLGTAATSAMTTLSGSGFTAAQTHVFSNTVPAGTVITQSPVAGTFLSPAPANPVNLTVSAGNGLRLALNRSVATADQTITLQPQAFDLNGNPTPLPVLAYSITPKQSPFAGPLPTIGGMTITLDVATMGAFTVTASDAANARSASADFSVLPPKVPGKVGNGESFAHMAEVLDSIYALKQPLKAALAANDTAQMTSLLQQIVTLWRTIDMDDLRISMPLVTPDKFAPTIDMMAGFGLSATPDDVISHAVLKDSITDLAAWTAGLKTSGLTMAQLNALADQFSTRAARMDGLVISRYGGINNSSQYTRLMAHEIPDFYEALTNELAELTGMPRREPSFPFMATNNVSGGSQSGALSTLPSIAKANPTARNLKDRKSHHVRYARVVAAPGTLAEQLVTIGTQLVVDKIMDEADKTYKNAKQYAVDIMWQCAWTATAVSLTNELRTSQQGKKVDEVFSGASLSFREFQAAPAWIESDAADDPKVNVVILIGPDLFTKTVPLGQDMVGNMKEGYSYLKDVNSNPNKYKNQNEVKNNLSELVNKIKTSFTDFSDAVKQQSKLAMQSPDEVMNGCLLPTNPTTCRQLIYQDGIKPVYTYNPPPSFETLGGLPLPIIFIVYDASNGGMSFGTPSFMPCTYTDDSPKKIKCPNSDPIPLP